MIDANLQTDGFGPEADASPNHRIVRKGQMSDVFAES
jgi:hypothetical protein